MPDSDRLLNAIDYAEEYSYGSDSDGELADQRAKAIDYYLGKMAPAPDGRSNVVDRSVYETVQYQMPSLARIFANGDNVVELPPIGPDDEEGAKQEGEYLNYQLVQKNDWFQIFDTAGKDGLICKAGYLYAYREKRKQLELESYKRQTEDGVALIMQDKPEVLNLKEYPDPEYQPQPMVDQMGQPVIGEDGAPVMQPPPMLYDLDIRRTKEEVAYCVVPLPPERCKVAKSHNEVQLVGCPYFEYWDMCTISYLREMGLDVPDDISDSDTADTIEDASRDLYGETTDNNGNTIDPAMRKVKARWIWIQHDYDEDGLSELNYVIRVGRQILHREECNEIPVGVLCPDPLPHRHVGQSSADTAVDIQDLSTSVLRQGMDNLYLSNNPRQFGDPAKVNLDDMLVSRPGGITRTRQGAVFMQDFGVYAVPNVFPQAMEALEYFKQVKEDRTGVSRYSTGTDANSLNKTATGVQMLSTMSAQRLEQIARHYANGVKRLCAVLHALILKGGHKAEVVKLRGKWVTVDPSTWRSRKDFRICVGYSAGNKDAQASRLMALGNMQKEAMMGGLPIVNPRNIYETAIELTKASDFSNPERFWTDPSTVPPPPPPQPDVTVVAMEQIKSQTTLQVKDAELRTEKEIKAAELAAERSNAELDAQTKLTIEQMKQSHASDLKDKDAQNTIGIEREKASLNLSVDEHKTRTKNQPALELADQVKQQAEALHEALESMKGALSVLLTAKRQIRRGKNGKAEGVDLVGPDGAVISSQSIVRGPDGRAMGTQ